jgi:type III pantothenate kinase
MNLVIDIGNTSTKLAIYNEQLIKDVFRYDEVNIKILDNIFSKYIIGNSIISSVKDIPDFLTTFLEEKTRSLYILSYKSRLPFIIEYDTPETLGPDRIAAVAGAFDVFRDSDVLVIDAGTAITFDFLIETKYKGGNISPGINMRFRALNKFTTKLPIISRKEEYSFPARNTSDAIIAGVITGVTFEINEYIRTFKKKYKNLKVIITGGDGSYLKDKISAKTTYMPDIVTDGLNFILNYNAK